MENPQQPEAEVKSTAIAEYSETEAHLATFREKYGRTYDVTKPPEMAEARVARAELRSTRTALEEKRKALKAPLLKRGKMIDDEATRIEAELLKLEEPIDEAIKTEEKRREEVKAAKARAAELREQTARSVANEIRGKLTALIGATSAEILFVLDGLAGEDFTVRVPQEEGETHLADVEAARSEVLAQLKKMHEATKAQEEVQRQIAADKKRQADEEARLAAERERLAEEQKAADAKAAAERERIEAEKQAAKEKIAAEERAAEQRRAEADKKAAAERERLAKEQQAKLDAERAKLDAERKAADEKARKEQEAKDAAARHEREVAEAKQREAERAEFKRMDGYAALRSFVERFADVEEFKDVAGGISQWLASKEPAPAPAKAAVVKKGKVA